MVKSAFRAFLRKKRGYNRRCTHINSKDFSSTRCVRTEFTEYMLIKIMRM